MGNRKKTAMANTNTSNNTNDIASLITSFMQIISDDQVKNKLIEIISLPLEARIMDITVKLDKLITENKNLNDRINQVEATTQQMMLKINSLETENVQQKKINKDINCFTDDLSLEINQIEQNLKRNSLLLTGVKETFAERTSVFDPNKKSEDVVSGICKVINDACNIVVQPDDILSAYRLQSKVASNVSRPLVISFHSTKLRDSVIKARKPGQTLSYNKNNIYFSDYLTSFNSNLLRKAKDLVKKGKAAAAWSRNGTIYIKWSAADKPSRISSEDDL